MIQVSIGRTLVGPVLCGAVAVACGQAGGGPVSAELQPALGMVSKTVAGLSIARWKGSKALKDATVGNVGSIRKDLDGTLPGLLTSADAAPGSLATMLPVSRNLGALYEVLLRVTVVAEAGAPAEQTAALEQALKGLEDARRSLADQIESAAAAEDARVSDLRKQVAAKMPAVASAPVAAAPLPCKPVVKKKTVKKAAASPS